jgi:hypothetical protein
MSQHTKEWMSRKEAAAYLSSIGTPLGRRTLDRLAIAGKGPPYKLVVNRAVYNRGDLDGWASRNTVNVTPEVLARKNAAVRARRNKRDNLPYVSPLKAAQRGS